MSDETYDIDDLIKSGRDALSQGRYEDATSYIGMASKQIDEQIRNLGRTLEKTGESSDAMARLAEKLEKLQIRQRTTTYLLETIDKEKDRANRFRKVVEGIIGTRIVISIQENKERIDAILSKPRTIGSNDSYFLCLRKWNSYTPLVNVSEEPRQGGGYFLAWNGKGIVIDPGIGFLQNFLSSGYSISDIDAVLITHSHVDHTSDFEAILTLLQEVNDLRRTSGVNPHKPKIYLNIGAATKFMQLLSISYENVEERVLLDPGANHALFPGLTVTVCEAFHSDLYAPRGRCVGLLFGLKNGHKSYNFGVTSDTGYMSELKNEFSRLNGAMIILHLGSILEDELRLEGPTERIYREHLGIRGAFNLIYDVSPRLAVISEIGEELQDCICSLAENLRAVFPDTVILPADVGLKIDLSRFGDPLAVECQGCETFVNIEDVIYSYASDKGNMRYLCKECNTSGILT